MIIIGLVSGDPDKSGLVIGISDQHVYNRGRASIPHFPSPGQHLPNVDTLPRNLIFSRSISWLAASIVMNSPERNSEYRVIVLPSAIPRIYRLDMHARAHLGHSSALADSPPSAPPPYEKQEAIIGTILAGNRHSITLVIRGGSP